jgi:hypothetical protein
MKLIKRMRLADEEMIKEAWDKFLNPRIIRMQEKDAS